MAVIIILGERIAQLRKEHSLSQGDLAEALEVSRQSVSKWETDAATPELDKLIKMGKIFNIGLDELVTGERAPNDGPASSDVDGQSVAQLPPPIAASQWTTRRVLGIVLLGLGLLALIILTAAGGDLLLPLLFSSPLIVCGAICLLVRRHTLLSCLWALYLLISVVGSSGIIGSPFWIILGAVMLNGAPTPYKIISCILLLSLLGLLIATVRLILREVK